MAISTSGTSRRDLGWFLADLARDVGEERNLVADAPAVAARLYELHATWRKGVGLPVWAQAAELPWR